MMAIKTKPNEPRQPIKMYSVMVKLSLSSSSGFESEKKGTIRLAEDNTIRNKEGTNI